jgi:hypothetical protein
LEYWKVGGFHDEMKGFEQGLKQGMLKVCLRRQKKEMRKK